MDEDPIIVNDQNKELFCQWCENIMAPRTKHYPQGEMPCRAVKLDG